MGHHCWQPARWFVAELQHRRHQWNTHRPECHRELHRSGHRLHKHEGNGKFQHHRQFCARNHQHFFTGRNRRHKLFHQSQRHRRCDTLQLEHLRWKFAHWHEPEREHHLRHSHHGGNGELHNHGERRIGRFAIRRGQHRRGACASAYGGDHFRQFAARSRKLSYSATNLSATGGFQPYTSWIFSAPRTATLPPGFSLSTTCPITVIPT